MVLLVRSVLKCGFTHDRVWSSSGDPVLLTGHEHPLLTSIALHFWHFPLQTFSHRPPLGTLRLFQCTEDTLFLAAVLIFFNFFLIYKRLKNVNAISTSVHKQHQQQTLSWGEPGVVEQQDVKIQLLGDKHGAVSSCLTHAWTVKQ